MNANVRFLWLPLQRLLRLHQFQALRCRRRQTQLVRIHRFWPCHQPSPISPVKDTQSTARDDGITTTIIIEKERVAAVALVRLRPKWWKWKCLVRPPKWWRWECLVGDIKWCAKRVHSTIRESIIRPDLAQWKKSNLQSFWRNSTNL